MRGRWTETGKREGATVRMEGTRVVFHRFGPGTPDWRERFPGDERNTAPMRAMWPWGPFASSWYESELSYSAPW